MSLALWWFSFVFATAHASTNEVDLFSLSLEQLLSVKIETLNKRPQLFMELPAAVYVIERKEIERSGALTVPDLLARIPGVFVKQVSKNHVAVSIRSNAEYFSTTMLILIDGNPYYFQSTGNTVWSTLPVAVEDIERIEVIRGDGGTVWGTNSSSGVVNILTRAAESEPRARVTAAAGNQSMVRLHGEASGDTLRVSGHVNQDKGWSDDPASWRSGNMTARYNINLADWKTTITGNTYRISTRDVASAYNDSLSTQDTSSYNISAATSRQLGQDKLELKVFHYDYKSDVAALEIEGFRHATSDIEARYMYWISKSQHSHFGLNYRRYNSKLGPQPYANQTQEKLTDWVSNFTVDHEVRLKQQTTFNLGLRYERSSLSNDDDGLWSYSARLSSPMGEKTVLWGNIQQSWLFPPYQSSDYVVLTSAQGTNVYYQQGNPRLKPERHRSVELGLRKLFNEGLLLNMSTYYAVIKNDATPDPAAVTSESDPPLTYYYEPYTNHLKSKSWGLELLLDWDSINALRTQWGITYFRKKLEIQDGIYRGPINDQYAPEWKFNLNAQYGFNSKADVSLMMLYETAHDYTSNNIYTPSGQTDEHFRLDGSINYKFATQGILSLGFKNLFNSGVEWKLPSAVAQPQEVEPSVYLKSTYQW